MQAVLTYIYSGGTQVVEEDLSSFLAAAEDLQVKGLTRKFEIPTADKITDTMCEDINNTPWMNKNEMVLAEDLQAEGLTRHNDQDELASYVREDSYKLEDHKETLNVKEAPGNQETKDSRDENIAHDVNDADNETETSEQNKFFHLVLTEGLVLPTQMISKHLSLMKG